MTAYACYEVPLIPRCATCGCVEPHPERHSFGRNDCLSFKAGEPVEGMPCLVGVALTAEIAEAWKAEPAEGVKREIGPVALIGGADCNRTQSHAIARETHEDARPVKEVSTKEVITSSQKQTGTAALVVGTVAEAPPVSPAFPCPWCNKYPEPYEAARGWWVIHHRHGGIDVRFVEKGRDAVIAAWNNCSPVPAPAPLVPGSPEHEAADDLMHHATGEGRC